MVYKRKIHYRYRKIKNGKQRLAGYMKKGKFIEIKEIKTIRDKKQIKTLK